MDCSFEGCSELIHKIAVSKIITLRKENDVTVIKIAKQSSKEECFGYCKKHSMMISGHYDLAKPSRVRTRTEVSEMLNNGYDEGVN